MGRGWLCGFAHSLGLTRRVHRYPGRPHPLVTEQTDRAMGFSQIQQVSNPHSSQPHSCPHQPVPWAQGELCSALRCSFALPAAQPEPAPAQPLAKTGSSDPRLRRTGTAPRAEGSRGGGRRLPQRLLNKEPFKINARTCMLLNAGSYYLGTLQSK